MLRTGLLAIVLVVLLAGCVGVVDDTDREPYTVDEPVSPSPADALEGIGDDGVENAVVLREAHQRAVGTDSYRVETEVVVRKLEGDGGFERQQSIVRDSGHRTAHVIERQRGDPMGPVSVSELPDGDGAVVLERWESAEVTIDRLEVDGTVEYDEDATRTVVTESVHLQALSWIGPATVDVRHDDDGRYYRFESDRPARDHQFDEESFEARIHVTDEGVIEAFEMSAKTRDTGTPIQVTVSWSLTDRGEVTPEEPDWVGGATD